MRYVVNFESQDDLSEFARVLDNVNRHIEFTYTLNHVAEYPTWSNPSNTIEYFSVILDITPVKDRSVTLKHMGDGLVRVTVRRSNGTILLETDTHTAEAYKPTAMRDRLCGMAAAFSQKVTSKHAGISTNWELLAYEFSNLSIPVVMPVQSVESEKLDKALNPADHVPVVANEDLSRLTFSCDTCGDKAILEIAYGEVECRMCRGCCSVKTPAGRNYYD